MVYKIGNTEDMVNIPDLSEMEERVVSKFANIFSSMYGKDRDIDHDYGGYILFIPEGTNPEEIKDVFDYDNNLIEYVEVYEEICAAVYITSTEYGVVLVMSVDDAPDTIRDEIQKKPYKVQIREVLSRVIEVEARTKKEAMTMVREKYQSSEIILNADDFENVEYIWRRNDDNRKEYNKV